MEAACSNRHAVNFSRWSAAIRLRACGYLTAVVLLSVAVASSGTAVAQQTPSVDSLSVGYQELLREYASFVRIPETPDSTASDNPDDRIQRLEIDGLVVDETRSRLGRVFYDVFYREWEAPPGSFNFTITVQEQPAPNLGTRVSIKVNGEIAFRAQLLPRNEMVEAAARQAVYYVWHHLENRGSRPTIL